MTFDEVYDEILGITARPDREVEIKSAINATLSKSILKTSFARDLVETTIEIDPTLYGDTIQFNNADPALVTRFRKFKYVKPTGVKRYLKAIGSDQIFQPGEQIQRDRYYVGGDNLTYTLKELSPTLEIGYYQYAPTLVSGDTHWFLELAPWAIIDLAAARIFRSIGDDASAVAYERSGTEFYNVAKRDFADSILTEAT